MFSTLMKDIFTDEAGATAIEYGLILALIAIAITVSLQAFAGEAIAMWDNVATRVVDAING
ncbi:MAG: Flp family type IVb pilin [Erythrobacter sp.]|nr:Flp family type IVb pilin [Erythrobacter sp.]